MNKKINVKKHYKRYFSRLFCDKTFGCKKQKEKDFNFNA